LRIGVSEPPEDGKANKAVCAELAKAAGVAQGGVQIISGGTSREKTVLISGNCETIVGRLIPS
jgi:uncharacterized protein YggU (UPF0235/DUF167 family)